MHPDSLKQACKKQKVEHPSGSLLPAAFWDNLSEVWLTHNAVRELDRRSTQATADVPSKRQSLQPITCNELKAIQSGPDLSELRGYPEPIINSHRSYRIQKSQKCSGSASRDSSTSRSTTPSTIKMIGPYDRNFQQHLIDYGIYPPHYEHPDGRRTPEPTNFSEIKERLARRRSSLSPSKFTKEMHKKFVRADAHAFDEKQIESVISVIEGGNRDSRCVTGGIPLKNLDHLTDGTLVPGIPDRYHGARPEQLDRQIRIELNDQIVPTIEHDLPIAPNFFVAVRGPDDLASVADRQTCYDGALGARGMHSLQEYGKDEPEYDNNARTLTSVYYDGKLEIFTSHPSKSSDRTEYYMTRLRSFSMIDTRDKFQEGATWYRNGMDWAKEQRDKAIRQANEKAAQNIVESTAVNETSSPESVESITEESHFSFNGANTTETDSLQLTRSLSPKPVQGKQIQS